MFGASAIATIDFTDAGFANIGTPTGSGAFLDCDKLTSITFPSTLKTIGNETFRNCTALTELDFPADFNGIGTNNASIGTRAFSSSGITTLNFASP
jgi:hypothetical protein